MTKGFSPKKNHPRALSVMRIKPQKAPNALQRHDCPSLAVFVHGNFIKVHLRAEIHETPLAGIFAMCSPQTMYIGDQCFEANICRKLYCLPLKIHIWLSCTRSRHAVQIWETGAIPESSQCIPDFTDGQSRMG